MEKGQLNTFSKSERLHSRKLIAELFARGSSFTEYPIRTIYLSTESGEHPDYRVMFAVPSRNFKKAVDRNKIKRRMREVYRLNKSILSIIKPINPYLIAYIYVGKEIAEYQLIEKKLKASLLRLVREASK